MPDPRKSFPENMRALAAGARVWADFLRVQAAEADALKEPAMATSLRSVAGMLHYVARAAASLAVSRG